MADIYRVTAGDASLRASEISRRATDAQAAHRERKEYKFRSGTELLPIISFPCDQLLYRLENYRTGDKQLALVATGKVPEDFFDRNRTEQVDVQQLQHEILVAQAKQGSGETIKPIFDELARTAEQTEDLIISATGIVVNGNRRLAAMRELLATDGERYARFADVLCAVLPASASAEEILQLEIGLQMQPETKLPYEWTALGRAVRDLRLQKMSDKRIAELMNRDEPDIARAAKMIDAADLYLSEWLGRANAYDQLEETEQAFKQIATRNLSRSDDLATRELTRKIDFFVIERRRDLSESAYVNINAIESNPVLFLETLANEWNLEIPVETAATADLSISFADVSAAPRKDYSQIADLLLLSRSDPKDASARIKAVEQVCRTVAEQGKNKDKAALGFARKALASLSAIDLQTANPTTYRDIADSLAQCDAVVAKLQWEFEAKQAKQAKQGKQGKKGQ